MSRLRDAEAAIIAAQCPQKANHTVDPDEPTTGYVAWHEWAERKSLTHDQRKCPGCHLWMIWTPKTPT